MVKKFFFCFDIDNTICHTKGTNYKSSKPIKSHIDCINKLYESGHKIIIYTARFMGRNNNKINLAKKQGYKFTYHQLQAWGLKFHELHLGKPAADFYIDDKSIDYRKNWKKKLSKYISK